MKRLGIIVAGLFAAFAVGCGGGSEQPASAPPEPAPVVQQKPPETPPPAAAQPKDNGQGKDQGLHKGEDKSKPAPPGQEKKADDKKDKT